MAYSNKYQIERKTASTDATPEALQSTLYWYDTGTTVNGEAIYYDNATDAYAYWNDGSEWLISAVADVGGTPTDYFDGDGAAQGTWTGSITVTEYTIADAWYRAETYAFNSLLNYAGCEEENNCFRGYLPQNEDGEPTQSNVWMMTSGGSGEFDTNRLSGDSGQWCSLRTDARIESIWETRQQAMEFAGLVMAWLKETNNLNEQSNIEWCILTDIPTESAPYISGGRLSTIYWQANIELELVYKTENVFE